jgi:hypothetical protein
VISHAEAIDRIGDAATERHGIERLMGEPSSDPELRAHIASCDSCQRELRAWQTTTAALMLAAPATAAAGAETVDGLTTIGNESIPPLPADIRDRVLASVQSRGVTRGGAPASVGAVGAQSTQSPSPRPITALPVAPPPAFALPGPVTSAPVPVATSAKATTAERRPVRFRWLALAAAAVLIVFVAGAILGAPLGLVRTNTNSDQLRTALAASGRILEQPNHRQAALVEADGTAVGSVIIDGEHGDIVVLSNGGNDTGATSAEYHCYLVRGDAPRTWLGAMVAQAGTSFWAGHVDNVTDLGRPGDVIQVVDGGATPEFTATF